MLIEVGVDASGANDHIGGFEGQVFRGFQDALEDAAEFPSSPGI
jgi:hypothetical protein